LVKNIVRTSISVYIRGKNILILFQRLSWANKKRPRAKNWSHRHHMTSFLNKRMAKSALSVDFGQFQPFWWLHRNGFSCWEGMRRTLKYFHAAPLVSVARFESPTYKQSNNKMGELSLGLNCITPDWGLRSWQAREKRFKWGCSTAPKGQPTFPITTRFSLKSKKLTHFVNIKNYIFIWKQYKLFNDNLTDTGLLEMSPNLVSAVKGIDIW